MTELDSRNYWPWLLFSLPFSAVIFGVFMVFTTTFYPDDLVVDNYYKDGMAINQRLTMDELAGQMRVTATLISLSEDEIMLEVSNATDSAIEVNLYHVTDRSLDRSFALIPESGSSYRAKGQNLDVLSREGIWYIELLGLDDAWRLRKRVHTPITGLEISAHE